jgi:hypothetical protein
MLQSFCMELSILEIFFFSYSGGNPLLATDMTRKKSNKLEEIYISNSPVNWKRFVSIRFFRSRLIDPFSSCKYNANNVKIIENHYQMKVYCNIDPGSVCSRKVEAHKSWYDSLKCSHTFYWKSWTPACSMLMLPDTFFLTFLVSVQSSMKEKNNGLELPHHINVNFFSSREIFIIELANLLIYINKTLYTWVPG